LSRPVGEIFVNDVLDCQIRDLRLSMTIEITGLVRKVSAGALLCLGEINYGSSVSVPHVVSGSDRRIMLTTFIVTHVGAGEFTDDVQLQLALFVSFSNSVSSRALLARERGCAAL
jgi:hypothetical protein